MTSELLVGFVGLYASRSRAKDWHIRAHLLLRDFQIAAVATHRVEAAKEAAEACGQREVQNEFCDLCDDQVDIVSVSIRVPAHKEAVCAAEGG
jgi:predicted dehydrogenase